MNDLILTQTVKYDDIINAVQKFGGEEFLQLCFNNLLALLFTGCLFGAG